MKKILRRGNSKREEFMRGIVGTPTNMTDSYGVPLFIGDVICLYNASEGDGYLPGSSHGLHYICEGSRRDILEGTEPKQYVMGIASIWNSERFSCINTESESDLWTFLLKHMNGWIVQKVKDYTELEADDIYDDIHPVDL